MRPAAIEAMTAVLATVGNASSLHGSGRLARRRLEESRETLAKLLGARPSEVIFTAGGTESDNLALKGIFWARRDADPQRRRIVTTPVEHHAVLDAVQWLVEHEGAEVTWLPVDEVGSVSPAALRAAIGDPADVALISVMWANNEVGTIMPIAELTAVAAEFDIPVHSDAIQAVGQIPVDFAASGLSAMSVAAHKFGGPTGVGALLLRRDTACVPLLHGGGQERDVRSGTQDVAGVVGMAAAARVAVETLESTSARVRALRDRLVDGVLESIDDVYLNGALRRGPASRQRALHLSRLRGRFSADVAGRQGNRMFDRFGVHRGGGAAVARADRDGRRPGQRARFAAPVVRPHQHRLRRRCRPGGAACGGGTRPPGRAGEFWAHLRCGCWSR